MANEPQYEGERPLEEPPFTMMHNYLLDVAMRDLSSNAWKVLCWAVRQTRGYKDASSPTGRKLSDVISYSQFLEATGIISKATLSRAIQDCIEKGYLLRDQVASGRGKQTFSYRLNTQYKVQKLNLATTDSVQEMNLIRYRNCTLQGTETEHTKERNKKQTGVGVVVTTLQELGIYPPSLIREMAEARSLEWVEAHLDYLENDPRGQVIDSPAGFLVWAHRENVEPMSERQPVDKRSEISRYIPAEYAEYIQH